MCNRLIFLAPFSEMWGACSHAHLLLGQAGGGKDRSHETQVMWCIESAFRLAPTMIGVAADVL